jgi:hypothetical protein
MKDMRNAHKILLGKAEVKRPFKRPRHRPIWEDDIKMDLKEIECEVQMA